MSTTSFMDDIYVATLQSADEFRKSLLDHVAETTRYTFDNLNEMLEWIDKQEEKMLEQFFLYYQQDDTIGLAPKREIFKQFLSRVEDDGLFDNLIENHFSSSGHSDDDDYDGIDDYDKEVTQKEIVDLVNQALDQCLKDMKNKCLMFERVVGLGGIQFKQPKI